ncbi:uncharacterized protein TEOVI_000178700 [Trypanosoma equiperdum]|uniref:Uncharacterized protein n=4 Tax=Trypanozoon TaxID=39700 RepID=Q383G6_TRYB2|nr:hypothetical protein, conserved [Trypanosoma brucei gambiense DAL972]XP_829177.1 hypothetical protein, conserved [Trypanosoma brucei brucei TREU927]RHW67965.1 hypothetical protein DPX39_110087500 [Trypanosoma brucei equiperdum]SCU70214.1 hypothetical protein, conserved [Trypanosoma equiperdum]EAN80065.1 hypothetical protein, conserved [Trypanosoma brucei brucei TREU927]CBH18125.1 hypothetical protein, conserved [Trypanosoma brucei gambiense DAL972]|eukprot:XP_011780389.1 hypothetical protein, conserved [Trypanosoma brucei gambiense DAL972]
MRCVRRSVLGSRGLKRPMFNYTRIFSMGITQHTFTGALLEDLRAGGCCGDQTEDNPGSSLRHGELDHFESPEAEAAHVEKVNTVVDDLFSRMPLPEDPMGAALAPTKEEMEEKAEWDVLKEVVRERYQRKIALKEAERVRIDKAMQHYRVDKDIEGGVSGVTGATGDSEKIRKKIERMKQEIVELERRLEAANHDDNL